MCICVYTQQLTFSPNSEACMVLDIVRHSGSDNQTLRWIDDRLLLPSINETRKN